MDERRVDDDRYDVVVIGSAPEGLSAPVGLGLTRRAAEARRAGPFSAAAERALCEQVLGDRRHGI